MNILALISGEYGQRHIDNIRKHAPPGWKINTWTTPAVLPPVIDYPEDFLPAELPQADLVLSFAEHKGVAELLPEIAKMCAAKSVLVAVDHENWLPVGLARQLHGWLQAMDVSCVTPKPLCSLTEHDYAISRRQRVAYQDARISEFARYFGQPSFNIIVDVDTRAITAVEVVRDAVCGCASFVAQGLIGTHVDQAEEKAGLLHHHYPCLASMTKLPEYNQDTLMHASGNLLKDEIREQIQGYITKRYIAPGKRST